MYRRVILIISGSFAGGNQLNMSEAFKSVGQGRERELYPSCFGNGTALLRIFSGIPLCGAR